MAFVNDLYRAVTDVIILCTLAADDSYGYEISKRIAAATGGEYEIKDATLYSAFKKLESDGQIDSYWGSEATSARRRYYTLTKKGRKEYEKSLAEWLRAKNAIDILINSDGSAHFEN